MNSSRYLVKAKPVRGGIKVNLAILTVAMAAAFLAGAYAYKHRAELLGYLQPESDIEVVRTSLYRVAIQKLRIPAKGRDGAIEPLDEGLLLSDAPGKLWHVDADNDIRPLDISVPINWQEFDEDPDNAEVAFRARFSVRDVLVDNFGPELLLIASHNQWDPARNCYFLRLSATSTSYDELKGSQGRNGAVWKTLFDSTPCLSLSSISGSTSRRPTISAGGRIAKLSESEVLLTVGDFGAFKRGRASLPQEMDNSYGKTVLIDLESGENRIFTLGHRNAQGMAVDAESRIWVTEHGPEGGDELNLLEDGENYGFPYVTYGTEYGTTNWPLNDRQGAHDDYTKPLFSWVPSIATSQVIVVTSELFPLWRDDLLISSLADRTIYRTRIENDRVVLIEPFEIGHRIRDIVEMHDGRIALKTDDSHIVYIEPVGTDSFDNYEPAVQGKFLATQCQGCHTFDRGGAAGIGPNLYQIVGRKVAADGNFTYSPALQAVEGEWTPEKLKQFLTDPSQFAPGTDMLTSSSLTEEQVSSLVAYLETLD